MRVPTRSTLVEFRKELAKRDRDRCSGDAEDAVRGLLEGICVGIAQPLPRIDGPHMLNTERCLVFGTQRDIAQGVVIGKHFDTEQRSEPDDASFGSSPRSTHTSGMRKRLGLT